MSTVVLGEVGTQVELQLTYGAAFSGYQLGITLADGTAVDLTGATFTAPVWRKSCPFDPLAAFSAVSSAPSSGLVVLSMPKETVLFLGQLDGACVDPVRLEWALFLAASSSDVRRVFYGPLTLFLGAKP